MTAGHDRLTRALSTSTDRLLSMRHIEGYWPGRLSSSALATATAISAFSLAGQPEDEERIQKGLAWLHKTQNEDHGWGDTPDSPSNLSTSLLVLSALRLAGGDVPTARGYITKSAGDASTDWSAAVKRRYGDDHTFAAPILMNCALAGLTSWEEAPALPFELAAIPSSWYRVARMQVVSYALPALIAIGLLIDHQQPSRNLLVRALRRTIIGPVLEKLAHIQPEHGGYLDATPLTAFVAMALLAQFGSNQPVARQCLAFLRSGQRQDGSWPIDTNLSIWGTTGAVQALGHAHALHRIDTGRIQEWIFSQQYKTRHPYTDAAPGGWAWTHLPGGVPDADDTSSALIALSHLNNDLGLTSDRSARLLGARWLLKLQNSDGGWPTFCRGWTHLPFDRSSPDITAHAIRALRSTGIGGRGVDSGLAYLASAQRPDGSWAPLWFGSQSASDGINATYGTARVLMAYSELAPGARPARRGVDFLMRIQKADGSWGGDAHADATVEETALSVAALAAWGKEAEIAPALSRGLNYLSDRVEDGTFTTPSPIGLYFASLWYSEALYPVIWTLEALGRAQTAKAP